MRKELNKWQFVFYLGRIWEMPPSWRVFRIGLINIHTFPEEGEALGKEHYRGFIFEKRFCLSIGKTCSVWYCIKKPWRYMQISAGGVIGDEVPYCEKHAKIADEVLKAGEVKSKVPIDYQGLK